MQQHRPRGYARTSSCPPNPREHTAEARAKLAPQMYAPYFFLRRLPLPQSLERPLPRGPARHPAPRRAARGLSRHHTTPRGGAAAVRGRASVSGARRGKDSREQFPPAEGFLRLAGAPRASKGRPFPHEAPAGGYCGVFWPARARASSPGRVPGARGRKETSACAPARLLLLLLLLLRAARAAAGHARRATRTHACYGYISPPPRPPPLAPVRVARRGVRATYFALVQTERTSSSLSGTERCGAQREKGGWRGGGGVSGDK